MALGLLDIDTVPKIWPDLPSTVQTKLLAMMRKVPSWLSGGPIVADQTARLDAQCSCIDMSSHQ